MTKQDGQREMSAPGDKFDWEGWLRRVGFELSALLAETIDVKPSDDEVVRQLVNDIIAIEQWAATD